MLLHRLTIDMIAEEDGEMYVEIETQGEPAFVTALGMLDMAREQLYAKAEEETEPDEN